MAEKSTQHYHRRIDVNEKLISSIDSGIIILDNELTIHYYNNWLEIHTLLKEKSVLGKSLSDVFADINTKTLKRKIKTALRMGTPTFYTANTSKYLIPIKINRLNISDFEHMRQDVSVIPFDEEKNLVLLIIIDQTDMINTNSLLHTNILKVQELNGELLKERDTINKKVLLMKFNTVYSITDISDAYLKLIKYGTEDILHSNFFEQSNFIIDNRLKKSIFLHVEEKKVFEFETIVHNKIGDELSLSCKLVPEYDSFANYLGLILFMEDITNSKKVIAQQEKLLVTSRSAAMGEMISMIAHQWRQPLSVINTVMAAMKIKEELNILDKESTQKYFSKIEETTQYLSNTIDDFRDYFKPNKIIKEISIADTVNKSTTFLTSEMKLLEIDYRVEIEDNMIISTYENEFIQCLINILKNSIDAFKEKNSDNKQVLTLIARKEATHISLHVKDNAGGIPNEILEKIYEPYFSTKAKNGTGLGLYMTKTIIEEHLKGKIIITSESINTDVLIELPLTLNTKKKEKL